MESEIESCVGHLYLKFGRLINLGITSHVQLALKIPKVKVRDNPKLLVDDGEMLKSQGRGWRFNSQL